MFSRKNWEFAYGLAAYVVGCLGGVLKLDIDEERWSSEQSRMDLGDGSSELIALRRADGVLVGDNIERHCGMCVRLAI